MALKEIVKKNQKDFEKLKSLLYVFHLICKILKENYARNTFKLVTTFNNNIDNIFYL